MRRMGFLGGSLIPRGGVLRGVGGGRGVGVGLFEEGGFLGRGGGISCCFFVHGRTAVGL